MNISEVKKIEQEKQKRKKKNFLMPLMTRTEDFPTVTQKALDFLYTLSNTIHEHFTFTSTQLITSSIGTLQG